MIGLWCTFQEGKNFAVQVAIEIIRTCLSVRIIASLTRAALSTRLAGQKIDSGRNVANLSVLVANRSVIVLCGSLVSVLQRVSSGAGCYTVG